MEILNQLRQYQSSDPKQIEFRERMIAFIEGNENCFESSHPPIKGLENFEEVGHITGSAWLLSPDKKSVLLTHHKKLQKWLQLGGHSDGETDVVKTAIREAQEESGIEDIVPLSTEIFDLDIHLFPEKKNIPAHLHYDVRFCLVAGTFNFEVSNESNDLKWMPLKEINSTLFEASIHRMAQKSMWRPPLSKSPTV